MGGLGSGIPMGATPRRMVEECLTLDVNALVRDLGDLDRPAGGRLNWNGDARHATAAVDFEIIPDPKIGSILNLRYQISPSSRAVRRVCVPIRLQRTRPHLGGVRWWFTCPLTLDGRPCYRRVGTLHLPPGAFYFGCRHCHGLSYLSRRKQSI